jgi:hypothetical protein
MHISLTDEGNEGNEGNLTQGRGIVLDGTCPGHLVTLRPVGRS